MFFMTGAKATRNKRGDGCARSGFTSELLGTTGRLCGNFVTLRVYVGGPFPRTFLRGLASAQVLRSPQMICLESLHPQLSLLRSTLESEWLNAFSVQ